MQSQESTDIVPEIAPANSLPQHSSKMSVIGVLPFSHGAFNSNRPAIGGFRDRHGGSIPAINTSRDMHGQGMQSGVDGQTPGTAYEMNFTPLLPSQLLMGSPFQPGSSSTFTSPQFQTFSNFTPMGAASQAQGQDGHVGSPVQNHQALSPQYQNMLSPAGLGAPQYYGGSHLHNVGYAGFAPGYGQPMHMAPGLVSGTSRTVYLGNIPPDTSAEEILGHVRSGQIESVRLLPDKNCAFISFLDGSSAVHFHSDAILKKLSIRGQDTKIGWGKPSQVPSSVALAIQQSGASRNVYLGNLPAEITEDEIREDLGKFGSIDTIKLVREKSIGFVHFLSISSAIKAVTQLPSEAAWQAPRRVFYGKDRCAYVSKTQQQNAAQYLGIAPGYAHVLNSTDRDVITNALAQQSVAAAAVATAAGGVNNLGNRTVYLGNIHPETTTEEICNVVRGGLLHHIRYIPDKHICFVTFIDPTSAASFYAMSNMQGLMIHNRRLKIGWGKHSQALPPAIALAVSGGASRNVYIGNIDETWSEERLRQDFSEYGEIELVNTLREKSCAFVNFTNIANAIKAIEAVRGKEEYKRFKINFGKDRCGNPPRQIHHGHNDQFQQSTNQPMQEGPGSPQVNGSLQATHSDQATSSVSPPRSGMSRPAGSDNMPNGVMQNGPNNSSQPNYSNQQQSQQSQAPQGYEQQLSPTYAQSQEQQKNLQSSYFGGAAHGIGPYYSRNQGPEPLRSNQQLMASHGSSSSFSANNVGSMAPNVVTTIGGMLAPSNSRTPQHSRAISLPAFSQYYSMIPQPQQGPHSGGYGAGAGFGGINGPTMNGYGLAIHGDGALPRWAEEEVGS